MSLLSLVQLKQVAREHAGEINIDWESLDTDPHRRAQFESVLKTVLQGVPALEQLYNKLDNGESISVPNATSPLGYEELEQHKANVADELFDSYRIADIYNRYIAINNVINT